METIGKGLVLLGACFALMGCSTSRDLRPGVYGDVSDALSRCDNDTEKQWMTNGYKTETRAIVGSRQRDAQVVLDTGKVLKIWVAPYTQGTTLIAAHDIYTVVEKPRFVVGEMVPRKGRRNKSCEADIPFSIKDKYLQTVSQEKRKTSSKKIKGDKYDKAIKKYIK